MRICAVLLVLLAALATGCARPEGGDGRPLVLRDEATGKRIVVPPEHADAVRAELARDAAPPGEAAADAPPRAGRWTKFFSFVMVGGLALLGLAWALPRPRRASVRR